MLREAIAAGLLVDETAAATLAASSGTPADPPRLHDKLRENALWWILEFLPKSAKYREWPARQTYLGFYIPDAEPRLIPEDAFIHESVVKRMDALAAYRPVNLPAQFQTVPMPVPPEHGGHEGV